MNVFNPDDTVHQLKIIPRFYPDGSVTLYIKNEESKELVVKSLEPVITDGYMYLSVNHIFKNSTNHQVKIEASGEVVYRGKIFVTNQANNTQAYKISKDIFTYE